MPPPLPCRVQPIPVLTQVSNQAYNLAWDEPTLLKFAGSCHYKK